MSIGIVHIDFPANKDAQFTLSPNRHEAGLLPAGNDSPFQGSPIRSLK